MILFLMTQVSDLKILKALKIIKKRLKHHYKIIKKKNIHVINLSEKKII